MLLPRKDQNPIPNGDTKQKTRILSAERVLRILKRMAVEIYEENLSYGELALIGIYDQGFKMAEYIHKELRAIDPTFEATLIRLNIDKENPTEVTVDQDLNALSGKNVVLVDDVLNTSRTLAYSLRHLLQININRIETAVLINRRHGMFPISATYKGYELATTLNEHIEVKLEGEIGAFIF